MHNTGRRIALLMAAIAVLSLGSSSAADKRKKKKEPESHPTVITNVTPSAISIREAKADKTVPITSSTEVYVRGQKAAVSALQPGMAVSITLAMDGDSASRINAGDPPPERATKGTKRDTPYGKRESSDAKGDKKESKKKNED